MSPGPARIAVLLSGRGSNYLALQRAVDEGRLPARVVLVLSNQPDAAGIDAAKNAGVPTAVLVHRDFASRAKHEAEVIARIEAATAEWVCLAGYMRLLSGGFVAHFPERILNIHPSLLPSFPGLDAVGQALRHGVRVSGCTVHLVDAGLDSGPIVEQRVVPVREDDDEGALAERILEQEHQAYTSALHRLLTRRWHVCGRRVHFMPPGS